MTKDVVGDFDKSEALQQIDREDLREFERLILINRACGHTPDPRLLDLARWYRTFEPLIDHCPPARQPARDELRLWINGLEPLLLLGDGDAPSELIEQAYDGARRAHAWLIRS
jgi:hypothetical protein